MIILLMFLEVPSNAYIYSIMNLRKTRMPLIFVKDMGNTNHLVFWVFKKQEYYDTMISFSVMSNCGIIYHK